MKFLKYLIIIIVPVYVLLTSIEYYTFSEKFYNNEFNINNTSYYTKLSEEDLKIVGKSIREYLGGKRENLTIKLKSLDYKEVFDENEKKHMKDVKKIYEKGFKFKRYVYILMALILFIAFIKNKEIFLDGLILNPIFTLVVVIIVLVLSKVDYYKYFNLFHTLFFEDGTWLFDDRSMLIKILPLEFFEHITISIIRMFLFLCTFFSASAFLIKRKLQQ